MNKKEWVEIHAICGDCGRRIREKIDFRTIDLKDLLRIIRMYYPENNMACVKCSNKRMI